MTHARLTLTPTGDRVVEVFDPEVDAAIDAIQLEVSDTSLVRALMDSPWERGCRTPAPVLDEDGWAIGGVTYGRVR